MTFGDIVRWKGRRSICRVERNDDVIDAVYVQLMSVSSCRAMLYGSDIRILAGAPILHKRYLIGRDTMGTTEYGTKFVRHVLLVLSTTDAAGFEKTTLVIACRGTVPLEGAEWSCSLGEAPRDANCE